MVFRKSIDRAKGDAEQIWDHDGTSGLIDDFHLGSAFSPKHKPTVKEMNWKIFFNNWDDLNPDKIEEMIVA